MKVREDIRKLTTTQTNLAVALNVTQPRIAQLIEEGVVVRDEKDPSGGVMIVRSLQNFYAAKARSSEENEVDFWLEKARHEKVKRELSELKLRKEAGELYEAATVERVLTELLADFRNKLSGLGHKLAGRLENLTAGAICDIIDREVEDTLKELSDNVTSEKYASAEDEDGDEEVVQVGGADVPDSQAGS